MKVGGQILWNVTHLFATRHRSVICWEDVLWKTFWATTQRTYYSIWFIGWVSPYNCEGSVKNPSIWKESFTLIVPRIHSLRGENLEGWRTDRKPWGVGDDGRIGNLLEKTQCERGDISRRKMKIFPIADGRIKPQEEIRNWEHTLGHGLNQFKERITFFYGELEGSLLQLHDPLPDAVEASMSGSFLYRHHVEPRVKLYSPREESFNIPLKYIRIWMSISEHWWLSRVVWSLDRFHTIHSTRWKSSWWIYLAPGEIDEETIHIQARSSVARTLEIKGKGRQAEGKAKMVWVGISSTPRIRNSRKPSRTHVRSWKRQLLLLCPEKLCRIARVADLTKIKQILRVFWKMRNLQQCTCEIRYRKIMKTTLQEKVRIHYSTTIRYTSLFLCLKLWEFRQRKQRWTRNGKNWRKFRRGTWRKSKVKRWSIKRGRRALQFILHHWWTFVIWKMFIWRQSTRNTKAELCSVVIL